MKLLRGFQEPEAYRGCFVAIGNFDGVHLGHQSMIARLVRHAQAARMPAVALTFDPHPIQLLRPEIAPPSLSILERKASLLEQYGVDVVIAYPTDRELLALSPQDFFTKIVRNELCASGMVEGPNFYFGKDRAGDVNTLAELCSAANMMLDVVEPIQVNAQLVSSSTVRKLVSAGEMHAAIELLGHSYQVRGVVEEGVKRGRTIGFPTANLGQIATLLPPNGVYAGVAHIDDEAHVAAINLGPNPTFGENAQKFEAHVINFDGDLYGQLLDVDFITKIRDVTEFDGVEMLQQQLYRDIEEVTALVNRELSR